VGAAYSIPSGRRDNALVQSAWSLPARNSLRKSFKAQDKQPGGHYHGLPPGRPQIGPAALVLGLNQGRLQARLGLCLTRRRGGRVVGGGVAADLSVALPIQAGLGQVDKAQLPVDHGIVTFALSATHLIP
jgi:hypothetical protein